MLVLSWLLFQIFKILMGVMGFKKISALILILMKVKEFLEIKQVPHKVEDHI